VGGRHSSSQYGRRSPSGSSANELFILTLEAARTHAMLVKLYRLFVAVMVLVGVCVLKYGLPVGTVLGFPVRSLFDATFVPVFLMLVSFRSDFPFNLLVLHAVTFMLGCLAGMLVTLSSASTLQLATLSPSPAVSPPVSPFQSAPVYQSVPVPVPSYVIHQAESTTDGSHGPYEYTPYHTPVDGPRIMELRHAQPSLTTTSIHGSETLTGH
jgi:hypothetical protein